MVNPTPPEGLTDAVKGEIDARMLQTNSALYLGFTPAAPLRAASLTPIPRYSLALSQPTTVEQIHALVAVSSWSYLVELTPDGGGDSLFIFAEAGRTLEGGFEYSSILNLPGPLFGQHVLDFADNQAEELAIIDVPPYYIEAFWKRTRFPANDVLAFVRDTFGRFPIWTPTLPNTVPLSDLVDYLNTQLE